MTNRVYIIHGWGGYPEEGWRPRLKKELEERDYTVIVPAMPETNNPKMEDWISYLSRIVETPDKNYYFVGHSLGVITILRYLETLKKNQVIGGAVFFAGFTDDLGIKEVSNFFQIPIDWIKIKSHCQKFISVHSDNDPVVSLKYGDIFKEKLRAEEIIMHNMKHFSGDDGIDKLPIALESILKLSKGKGGA